MKKKILFSNFKTYKKIFKELYKNESKTISKKNVFKMPNNSPKRKS